MSEKSGAPKLSALKRITGKAAEMVKSRSPRENRAAQSFSQDDRPLVEPRTENLVFPGKKEPLIIPPSPYPDIWESPRVMAQQAAERVAPESPALKDLFGVTRDDLYQMSRRVGNRPGDIYAPSGSRGSVNSASVMTPRNAQRMQDQIYEAQKFPELYKGMHGWYPLDPIYDRLLQLASKKEADEMFERLKSFYGMASPGSDVNTEIARGAAANYFDRLGSFEAFRDYAGMADKKRAALINKGIADRNNYIMAHADDLLQVPGHPYHSTSQATPMENYIRGGYKLDMDSPKVPLYIQASGAPHHPMGFQTDSAVPDAHFTRNLGMADIRRSQNPGESMGTSEYLPIRQWWRDQVTRPMGVEPVPGQAIVWGVGSKGTGVESLIGAPKLEMIADYINRRASKLGVAPDVARDLIITGRAFNEGGAVESDTQRFRREAEERIAADRQGYLDFIEKRKRLHGNKHPLRQIADQAARGVGSQVLALDDEGNLALPIGSDGIRAPGIYHHALSLPYALGSMFGAEGSAMDWSQEHDKKAGAINKRVADALDTNVEPRGLPQHLAASAGMMATQVPMRVFGAAKAAHGPLMSAVRAIPEYLGPTIGMPWKQNLAIGTVGGGVLGKLGEVIDGDEQRAGFADGGPTNPRTGALVRLGRGIARSLGEGTGYKSVPGKPATVEIPTIGRVETLPIPELEDAAARYMQSVGRPGEHVIREYPEFDEDLARRLSRAYDEMKHDPSDPRVQRSYQALADETMAQLDAIKSSGLDIRFLKPGMEDPYARSPALGYADIIENNRLYTYPTDFGFGSTDANADLLSTFKHPMLTPIGRLGDKDNAVVNDAFRVVHDAFGHFGPGNPFFRHKGEERAWLNHAPMYSPDARPAAAVELRGQNSYLNFGPNAEHNAKASGADTIYADQKLGLMPEWTWTEKSQKKPVQKAEGGEVEQQDDGVAPIREEISSARSLVESGGVDALRAAIESGEVSTVAAIAALHDFSQDDKGGEGFARGGSVGASEYDNMSFNRAFRLARQRALAGGDQVFSWRGTKYGTKLREEVEKEKQFRQQRARSQQPPAPPPPAPAPQASMTPPGAQQMPAAAVPVPPGGEVASGATQPLQVTQPRPAPAPRATAQPSAPQGPVLTPVAPAEGDAYQGYPLGMGTRNVQPMPQGSDAVNPPSAGYYGDIDPMASQGGVQLGYPRAQSQYDLDMQRYTGMPYAAMDNAPAFKRGGRVGALNAVARRAAR